AEIFLTPQPPLLMRRGMGRLERPVYFNHTFSQPKRDEGVIRSGNCSDHDERFTGPRTIIHGGRRFLVRNLASQNFFAGFLFEGIQVAVATADEHKTAFGDHGASAVIWRS